MLYCLGQNDGKLLVLLTCMPSHIKDGFDEVKVLAIVPITVVLINDAITVKNDGPRQHYTQCPKWAINVSVLPKAAKVLDRHLSVRVYP